MSIFKRLLSFAASAAVMLSAGASSVTTAAVGVSPDVSVSFPEKLAAINAPDWVPKNYLDAFEFINKHGATYVQGEYVCVIQQRSKAPNAYYAMDCTLSDKSSVNVQYAFSGEINFSPDDAPDKSDTEAYEVYYKRLKAAGISEDTEELDNYFRVEVYRPVLSYIDVTLEEGWYDGETPVVTSSNTYKFGYQLSIFNQKQRDIFEFMPDSIEEYNDFIKEHGNVCVFNNYLIYCGDVLSSAGEELKMEQNGDAQVREVTSYTVSEKLADMSNAPDGAPVMTVKMYEPVSCGECNVDFSHVRFDNTVNKVISSNFTIENDEAQSLDFKIVKNSSDLPEWVPTDYAQTVKFENEHGASYVADGYVCCIRRSDRNGKGLSKRIYMDLLDGEEYNPYDCQVYSKVFTFTKPENTSSEAYEKYLSELKQLGITEKELEYVNKEIRYSVNVFKPKPSSKLSVYFDDYRGNIGSSFGENLNLSFSIDKDGVITETDLFSWLPDTIAETREYIKKNGNISVHDEYLVFCSVSNAFSIDLSQDGIPELKKSFDYNFENVQLVDILGAPYARVLLYKGDRPGTLTADFGYSGGKSEYEPKDSEVSVRFDNDLIPSIISREDCDPLILGDCNYDGAFGISDVVVLQKWILGSGELRKPENADMNGDGVLDIFDLLSMKKQVVKGEGGSYGLIADPKPMLLVVSQNFAWGRQQAMTLYDENGAAYRMSYGSSKNGTDKNTYDELFRIGYDENWYERLTAMMTSENASGKNLPDQLVGRTRKLSRELDKHLNDQPGKMIGQMFDAGQSTLYLIGSDSDGKPAFLEIFTSGDVLGWIDCEEIQEYLKLSSYTSAGPDVWSIKTLETGVSRYDLTY